VSCENPFREVCAFFERFNKITFTRSCTIKLYDILKVKNALVKYVYYVAIYTICNLDTRETKYVQYKIGKEVEETADHRSHKTTQDNVAAMRQ
jgi:hypothetical protein